MQHFSSQRKMLAVERKAIETENPKYNIKGTSKSALLKLDITKENLRHKKALIRIRKKIMGWSNK